MKILITGAAGFIGSHLGNKLAKLGHDVIGIDNGINMSGNKLSFPCQKADFSQSRSFLKGLDVIVHLAAYINVDESIIHPKIYFDNNFLKTIKLLESVKKLNPRCKFIFASSAEVYGEAKMKKMTESHPLDPLSPYAVSKLAAEQACKNYAQLHGMDVTILRNFNTFGPYQRGGKYGGVIAKFAKLGRRGKDLLVYGSGEQMRDYTYISQAVDGYILAIEKKLPIIVNFGSGKPIKIIDIADYLAKHFKVKVRHTKSRPNEIMRLEADVSRAVKCGYKVQTNFWQHLDEYLDFVKRDGKV